MDFKDKVHTLQPWLELMLNVVQNNFVKFHVNVQFH